MPTDIWVSSEAYERYVGRWSRPAARELLDWLAVPPDARWLDVGSGTGVLAETILAVARPASVVGVDSSETFVEHARTRVPAATFAAADARELPFADESFDAVVSGLVLNFVPEPERAAAEIARVLRPGGVVGAYVWDYAGEMQLMRRFWDAAVELDPAAGELDEGRSFDEITRRDGLERLFRAAGLDGSESRAIDVPTVFHDFDDYWQPFLGGVGPAPAYAASLEPERRDALRETLRARLSSEPDGSIGLVARAHAARAHRPATGSRAAPARPPRG